MNFLIDSIVILIIIAHLLLISDAIKINNIYLLFFNLVFLGIISGQIFVLYPYFKQAYSIKLIFYDISKLGYLISSLIILFFLVFLMILIKLYIQANKKRIYINDRMKINCSYNIQLVTILSYFIVLVSFLYLLKVVGGVQFFIFNIRPTNTTGATLPLVVMLSTRIPMLLKIIYNKKIQFFDFLLILIVCVIYNFSGSRIVLLMYIVPLILAFFIFKSKKINAIIVIVSSIGGFFVLIILQSIKNMLYKNLSFFESIFDTIDTFFKVQVEGFTGLAGYISYSLKNGFSHDFGVSILGTIFRFFPGSIRDNFNEQMKYFDYIYGYNKSIVPPAFQNFFVYWSIFGIILLLVIIFKSFQLSIEIRQNNKRKGNFFIVNILFLSYSLILLRGSVSHIIFFMLYDIIFSLALFSIGKVNLFSRKNYVENRN